MVLYDVIFVFASNNSYFRICFDLMTGTVLSHKLKQSLYHTVLFAQEEMPGNS